MSSPVAAIVKPAPVARDPAKCGRERPRIVPGLRGDASILKVEQKLVKARESVAPHPRVPRPRLSAFWRDRAGEFALTVSTFLDKQVLRIGINRSARARAKTLAPTFPFMAASLR